VILGDEITITVLGVDGDRVRLGIDAPRRISVLREELYLQVKNANAAAAAARLTAVQTIAAAMRDPKPTPTPDDTAATGAPIT
jgi:carbon storage regulator